MLLLSSENAKTRPVQPAIRSPNRISIWWMTWSQFRQRAVQCSTIFVMDGVHEHKRVYRLQRPVLPRRYLRHDLFADFAYQFRRDVHIVQRLYLLRDIPLRHPAGVQPDDFFFHPVRVAVVFPDDLRVIFAVPVTRHADIHFPQLRFYPLFRVPVPVVFPHLVFVVFSHALTFFVSQSISSSSPSIMRCTTSANLYFIAVLTSAALSNCRRFTYSFIISRVPAFLAICNKAFMCQRRGRRILYHTMNAAKNSPIQNYMPCTGDPEAGTIYFWIT